MFKAEDVDLLYMIYQIPCYTTYPMSITTGRVGSGHSHSSMILSNAGSSLYEKFEKNREQGRKMKVGRIML
jgi:hypothetical protein